MRKQNYRYSSTLEIAFEDSEKAMWVYKSIYSDVIKTVSKDFRVDLEITSNILRFKIESNSLAKFRGIYKTILRLLHMLDRIDRLPLKE